MQLKTLIVDENDHKDLQSFLAERLALSKSGAKKLLDADKIWVNGRGTFLCRYRLQPGDKVSIPADQELSLMPRTRSNCRIIKLWEDVNYFVCNKAPGFLTCGDDWSVEATARITENAPDIEAVHRLDKETSGCLLMAKNHAAKEAAIPYFRAHKVTKIYYVLVIGDFRFQSTQINKPLDGEPALTHVTKIESNNGISFLRVQIVTGRTNQIRRHLASIRYPVLGDKMFGLRTARDPRIMTVPRVMLHASNFSMPNPMSSGIINVHSPLPVDFRSVLAQFGLRAK